MLKDSLKKRSDILLALEHKNSDDEDQPLMPESFDIHLEYADMTTIHEAYHFLMKKYVDGNEDMSSNNFLDMEALKARHERRKSNANLDIQDEKLSR